jgi:hypothetical protein
MSARKDLHLITNVTTFLISADERLCHISLSASALIDCPKLRLHSNIKLEPYLSHNHNMASRLARSTFGTSKLIVVTSCSPSGH